MPCVSLSLIHKYKHMRSVLFMLICIPLLLHSQAELKWLEGSWKARGQNIYEHWDLLSPGHLQGIGYRLEAGLPIVTEYLDLAVSKKELIYTATVVGGNAGQPVRFRGIVTDSLWVFENKGHDFPRRIAYTFDGRDRIRINLTGKENKTMSYTLHRLTDQTPADASTNPVYDQQLASRLEADDYGMKKYYFVILKQGPTIVSDTARSNAAFRGHMANINRLADAGQLVVAGPIFKNEKNYRGIFILDNITDEAELKSILKNDTAISEGLLDYEFYSWYGSAALPEYLGSHEKIWKIKP